MRRPTRAPSRWRTSTRCTRQTILRADISFHGKTLGAGSLTGSSENHFRFPGLPNIEIHPYGDVAAVKEIVERTRKANGDSDVYAVMVEPYSASSLRQWSEEALRELRRLCDLEDIILIFDEVYTGWGKTGNLFYFMRYDWLLPDILTYSKSLGGGKASISGYTAREKLFRKAYDRLADVILHSTTYYGFGEETATAIEAVNIVVEDDFPAGPGRSRRSSPRAWNDSARPPDVIDRSPASARCTACS